MGARLRFQTIVRARTLHTEAPMIRLWGVLCAASILFAVGGEVEARLRRPSATIPNRLLSEQSYNVSLERCTAALGRNGGLVQLKRNLRTLVIPDLHARRDYLVRVLKQRDPRTRQKYGDLLSEGQLQVVVLGDGMHAEGRAAARWARADRRQNDRAITREAAESLGTMKLVMDLKAAHPDNFHYLKGNHDNICNRRGGGDYPMYKYAERHGEAALLKGFLERNYGQEFVRRWSTFERKLPIVAVGKGFALAHSGPGRVTSKRAIQRRKACAVKRFTWTDLTGNNRRQDRIARRQLRELGVSDGFFLAGHRPARRVRRQGCFYQINSESRMYYAVLEPGSQFDPQRHLFDAAN